MYIEGKGRGKQHHGAILTLGLPAQNSDVTTVCLESAKMFHSVLVLACLIKVTMLLIQYSCELQALPVCCPWDQENVQQSEALLMEGKQIQLVTLYNIMTDHGDTSVKASVLFSSFLILWDVR